MNKRILIADDHYVVRVGTGLVLESQIENIFVEYAENYYKVKQKLQEEKFDLLILDIEMDGSIFKYMIKKLKKIQPDLMIMIFSSSNEEAAVEYIQEGAEGYLNKLSSEPMLVKAVQAIFHDGYYYPQKLIDYLVKAPQVRDFDEVLSEREHQVFQLMVEGNGNLEIANILDIQMTTASTYKRRVFAKLGVNNIVDLIKFSNNLKFQKK